MIKSETEPIEFNLPRLTVVIPSYNQADFLRECLESVVSQNSGNLELLVIDGGSTDHSVDVIREFASDISWWVSEPDDGQADAINKGLRRATGEVWSYLNSDDLLEPGSLNHVSRFFADHPEAEWLSGGCRVFGEGISEWHLKPSGVKSLSEVLTPWNRSDKCVFPQSGACFMKKSVVEKIGYFDPSYHYSMDMEYYTRAVFKGKVEQHITKHCLAAWRWHPNAKTFQKGLAFAFREDELRIAAQYVDHLSELDAKRIRRSVSLAERDLVSRRAMWALRSGNKIAALKELLAGVLSFPSNLVYRPWLGAIRRCLVSDPE